MPGLNKNQRTRKGGRPGFSCILMEIEWLAWRKKQEIS